MRSVTSSKTSGRRNSCSSARIFCLKSLRPASRILIINNGKIVANGTPEELASQAKGEEIVHIAIRGSQESIETQLDALDFVSQWNRTHTDNGLMGYQVHAAQGSDAAEALFHVVVENGWSLTELRQESVDLEDVFLNLTDKEQV